VNAAIVLFDGFEELDAFGPLEVLGAARACGADIRTELIQLDGADAIVTGAYGSRLLADPPSQDRYDWIFIPGGGWTTGTVGLRAAISNGNLLPWVKDQFAEGGVIAGVCTGAFALAEAGLLRDRPATTHHRAIHELTAYGAHPTDSRVVDGGPLLTCGGVTAGIDLTLHLINRSFGEELRVRVEDYLEYRQQHSAFHRQP
jgi:transcriptional regulator GlxA family with amidase domain